MGNPAGQDNVVNYELSSRDDMSFYKGYSSEVDSWPLMSSPLPVVLILAAYLSFVLYIGPRYMKGRSPLQLTNTMVVYNAAQVVMSFYVFCLAAPHVMSHGIVYSSCLIAIGDLETKLLNGIWVYFIIKITELLDSVFFVLRKKHNQLSFLHVYHHSILVVTTWVFMKYSPSEHLVFLGCINSLVHVIMYTYYALAALGPDIQPYLFWKKYITSLQLIQFIIFLFQIILSYLISKCPPPLYWVYFFVFNTLLFIYLFTDFYKKTYNRSESKIEKST